MQVKNSKEPGITITKLNNIFLYNDAALGAKLPKLQIVGANELYSAAILLHNMQYINSFLQEEGRIEQSFFLLRQVDSKSNSIFLFL